MIFSNKIYKIIDGINPTLYQQDENILNLYIFNKTLKKYQISIKDKQNCVFINQFNHDKIIQLNTDIFCPCNGNYITVTNENRL